VEFVGVILASGPIFAVELEFMLVLAVEGDFGFVLFVVDRGFWCLGRGCRCRCRFGLGCHGSGLFIFFVLLVGLVLLLLFLLSLLLLFLFLFLL
jgi:hypothetical protein